MLSNSSRSVWAHRLAVLGALLLISAIPAVPALVAGFPQTHDGLFHLYRLAALDRAFHAGVFYPRLFPEFAFGYGYAVLNFYSPAAYFAGETFHLLGFDLRAAYSAVLCLGFAGAAGAAYLFARLFIGRAAATAAATVYIFAPYHLAEVYVRGAVPEFLAFVFLPLVLWAVHRLAERRRCRYVALTGIAAAGLILTHNLTAFMFAPWLVAYSALLALRARDGRLLVAYCIALAAGAGLSAFYWLPALAESRFVALGAEIATGTGYTKHLGEPASLVSPFLAYRYFPEQGVAFDYPLSLVQAALFALSLQAAAWQWRTRPELRWLIGITGMSLAVSLALSTTVSALLWRALPVLGVLQYPWRFLVLSCLAGALLVGLAADAVLHEIWARPGWLARATGGSVLTASCVALIVTSLWSLPAKSTPVEDGRLSAAEMWANDASLGQIGATWSGEYVPVTVTAARSDIPKPQAERTSADGASFQAATEVTLTGEGYGWLALESHAPAEFGLSFHAFDFPGWTVSADGVALPTKPSGDLGLLSATIPAGEHRVEARFADTPVRSAGWVVSAITLAALAASLLRWRAGRRAIVLALVGAVAFGALTWAHSRGTPEVRLQASTARFGEVAQLAGYRLPERPVLPGDVVTVDLYWLTLQKPDTDYKVFVHLLDAAGDLVAQQDGDSGGGYTPTSRWLVGEVVPDSHVVTLPADAIAGEYFVAIGVYALPEVKNLPIAGIPAGPPDDRLILGKLAVRP